MTRWMVDDGDVKVVLYLDGWRCLHDIVLFFERPSRDHGRGDTHNSQAHLLLNDLLATCGRLHGGKVLT